MKLKTAFLPALALALALSALTPQVLAQGVAGAPAYIDYQGMVFDGTTTDEPLGSTGTGTGPDPYVAAPTNYTMEFRIYDKQSAGILIWAETQTVTVSLGAFAVRLGSGASIPGLSPAPTQTSIAEAFDDKDRYLELSVKVPPATTATAITPRLAFQSSPFSFVAQRAVLADTATLASSVNGVVTATAGSSFAGTVANPTTFTGPVSGTFGTLASPATFVGDGSGLTGLDFVDLTTAQDIAGHKTFTNGKLTIDSITSSTGWKDGLVLTGNNTNGVGLSLDNTSTSATKWSIFSSGSSNGVGAGHLAFIDGSGYRMVIDPAGNVGIGLTAPEVALHVKYDHPADNVDLDDDGGAILIGSTADENLVMDPNQIQARNNGAVGKLYLNYLGGDVSICTLAGNVGIGTSSPTKGKLQVTGGVTQSVTWSAYMNNDGSKPDDGTASKTMSIWAEHTLMAAEVLIFSDARIKNVQGRSDQSADLDALLGIEITDYVYKDVVAKGRTPQKKVIAQQVEKVFPMAVSKYTDVVPDIYQKAAIADGWVELATDLKVGERVRLMTEKEEGIHEVLEVREGAFRTAFKPETEKLFVYGREVDDFRTVDYDAIAMLNVSATQELARKLETKDAEVKTLQKENSALRASLAAQEKRLAALEAKDKARDAKFARFEKLLDAPADLQPVTTVLSRTR